MAAVIRNADHRVRVHFQLGGIRKDLKKSKELSHRIEPWRMGTSSHAEMLGKENLGQWGRMSKGVNAALHEACC